MNLIEERIRAAAQAAAETVAPDSVPPLELPAGRPRRFGRGRRAARSPGSAWSTWGPRVAPLAAAAAVIALVITLVNVGPAPAPEGPELSTGSAAGPAPLTPQGYVASGQVPRFYVQVTVHGAPGKNPAEAVVHATATGAVLAVVPPLAGHTVIRVTTAANGRTFVLEEEPWTAAGRAGTARSALAILNVTAAGRIQGMAALPYTAAGDASLLALALSADGTRLAFASQPATSRNEPTLTNVTVLKLAGGTSRTWSATGDLLGGLSWTADGKELAFNWQSGQSVSARLLDLTSPGGSLLGHSRVSTTLQQETGPGGTFVSCAGGSLITPDGTAVVCAAQQLHAGPGVLHPASGSGFAEFSAATGKLIRVLGQAKTGARGRTAMDVLWSDPSGRVLIGAVRLAGRLRVGVISGNTVTLLPVTVNPAAPDLGSW
jgi:hypothetical protein